MPMPDQNLPFRQGMKETSMRKRMRETSTALSQDWMTRNLSCMFILRVSKNWYSW